MGGLVAGLRELSRQNIGLALFLAWNYIALYGCAMAIGSFVPYNLEFIWLVSGAAMLVCSAGMLAIMRARPAMAQPKRSWGAAAMACAIAGNISLWLCYAIKETFWVMFAFAGVFDGIACVLFTMIWGARLTRCNEARIEFDVVACFVIALALYAVTLPIKLYGLVDLAVECILPPLSAWLAFHEAKDDPDALWAQRRMPDESGRADGSLSELRTLGAALLLMAVEWFVVAFFRVVDAPVEAYNRYQRYFIAFTVGFLVTLALFSVLIRQMRHVNLAMSYRWLLPFAMLNAIVLSVGGWGLEMRIAAYAVIHTGMFGMQMALWIALAKYLRRSGGRPAVAFAGMAAAQGIGIGVGCGAALLVVTRLGLPDQLSALMIVTGAATLVMMAAGFGPACSFARRRRGLAPEGLAVPEAHKGEKLPDVSEEPASSDYDALMHQRALDLQRGFGLTVRETEVAELLLCGRSRPYIRDELDISLNTVHAHARSILAKCGVHSQRELIDLAPGTTAPDLRR